MAKKQKGLFDDDEPARLPEPERPFNSREAFQLTRKTDPSTSRDAAERVVPELRELQQRVFDIIRVSGPVTHDDIIVQYRDIYVAGTRESTIRTRVSELVEIGLVRASGVRCNTRGRRTTLWSAA